MKKKFFTAVVSIMLLLSGLMVITGGGLAESKEEEVREENEEDIIEPSESKQNTMNDEVDELIMHPSEHTYVMVGDTINVTATAWDNSKSEPVSDIELEFTFEKWGQEGDAEFITASVVTTDEDGVAEVIFDPGEEVGDRWVVFAENQTTWIQNHTAEIEVVEFRGDLEIYDEDQNQWIGQDYYEEKPDVQIVEQALAKGGSTEFAVRMRNRGSMEDTIVFSWDNSSFPDGWELEVLRRDFDTWEKIDITEDGSYEHELWLGSRRDFYLRVHSDPDADHEDRVSVNVSVLDSGGQWDNGTLEAYIPTPDVMWMSIGSKDEALDPEDGPPMPVSEFLADLDLPPNIGLPVWGVLYNTTIMSPVEITEVTWTLDGADAYIDPESGSESESVLLNTGPSVGTVTLNASYEVEEEEYWVDEWTFHVTVGWDYVEIIDEPDGDKVEDQDVEFADTMYLYAGVYNETSGYVTTTPIGQWEYDSDMVKIIGVDEEHFGPEFKFVGVGEALVELYVMMPGLLLHDNVTFNISQPDVDSIRITDVPGGDWLHGDWVDVGQYRWFNVSAYNEKLDWPVYLPDINVEDIGWEIDNEYGATGELEVIDGMAKVYSGRTGGRINLTASYYDESQDETFHSKNYVHIHVSEPTVDKIAISYTPDGENKVESGTIAYGTNITGYACAYNNTIGFIELVHGYWSVGNSGDVVSSTYPEHSSNHSVFSAETEVVDGESWWNLTYYGEFTYSYSVKFDYLAVDDIDITYYDGTVVEDGTEIAAGDSIELFASAYNSTEVQNFGFVPVSWDLTNHSGAEGSIDPTEDSLWTLLSAGTQPGEIEIIAEYGEMSDSVSLEVVPGSPDYVQIELEDGSSPLDEYSADDTTVVYLRGYDRYDNLIGDLEGDWELDGDNATLDTDTGTEVTVDWVKVGSVNLTAEHNGVTDSIMVTVTPGELESIEISPDDAEITADDTQQFEAVGLDAKGNEIPGLTFDWEATNGTITDEGLFSPWSAEEVTINATYGDYSDSVTIEVTPGAVESVTISPDETQTVDPEEDLEFSAEAYDQYNNLITDDVTEFEWENAEDGIFSEEEPGEYNVNATYDGVTSPDIKVIVGEEYEVKVGPVLDNAGDPVEGATVELSWGGSETTTTDSDGMAVFTLNFDPTDTEFSYTITHDDLDEPVTGTFTGAESDEISIDIGEVDDNGVPGFTLALFAVALVVAVIGGLIFFAMKKKPSRTPSSQPEEETVFDEEEEVDTFDEELDEGLEEELDEEFEEIDEEEQ